MSDARYILYSKDTRKKRTVFSEECSNLREVRETMSYYAEIGLEIVGVDVIRG